MPVMDGETLIGVLDVDSTRKSVFDESDAKALERIAALIAA